MSPRIRPGPASAPPPAVSAEKAVGLDELLGALDQAAREANRLLGASAAKADAAALHATPANPRRRKGSKPKRTRPAWTPVSVAVLAGLLVTGIQVLSREAIWRAWVLPPVKYWYGYVPHEVLRRLVAVTGVQPLLASGPLLYPVAAVALAFLLARAAGLGKARVAVIFRLAGFLWDRNAFCRGWLITGATGSGKTSSSIVNKFHGVFRHEAGTLREGWAGSELEAKAAAFEALYRQETAPVMARLEALRERRERLKAELEWALQRRLIGEIEFEGLTGPQRDRRLAALKAEAEAKKDEELAGLQKEKADHYARLNHLSGWTGGQEELEARVGALQRDLEVLESQIQAVINRPLEGEGGVTSRAAADHGALSRQAAELEREIGRLEWRELQPARQRYDRLLRQIESAKYRSYPWGGLCIDEKGLFWQTLVPMARHYEREHHLMLLQTRPDWAPPDWKPAARFNLLSNPKIPTTTYAAAIVETASTLAGGSSDQAFFKTAAQKWIGVAIELQWGVREFQVQNGLAERHAATPNLRRCLELLTSIDHYREWLVDQEVLPPLSEAGASKAPAALGAAPASAAQAQAKKLASLVPDDAFLSTLPARLRKALVDFRGYWSQPAEQMGGVIGTIGNYLTYFAGDDVAEVFCEDNTVDIKDMDRGMIFLVAMPQKLQTERRYVCTLLKLLFYHHVRSRFDLRLDSEAWIDRNVLICWQDEAQRFVTEADGAVDTIREALGTTVIATQSLLSLYPPLGGKDKAEPLLLNLRNREIFQVADGPSAEITADFIGKREVKRKDRSVSPQGTTFNYRLEDQHKVKPQVLRELPKYTAVVCHCDGKHKKVLIPPRDSRGRLAPWWLERDAPFFYRWGAKLGLVK